MFKLNENGFITTMNDTIIYNNEEEYDDYGVEIGPHRKINPNVFFNDRNSSKFDILMYECNNLNQYIRLPITNEICKLFKKEVHEKVSFIFNDTYKDTPCTDENIKRIDIRISNTRDAINAYIQYITYRLINYLPYEDFSIDHMPTLETVLIDDEKSDFFDRITMLINEHIEAVKYIAIYKNGKYKFIYDSENGPLPNKENKKPKFVFIRVNDAFPLFYEFTKFDYKNICKLVNIEITLSWYKSEDKDYLTEYTESTYDEYLYSNTDIQSILTLDVTFGYLYSYYMNESKEIADNNFLIITLTGYYKLKDGMVGIKYEMYDKSIRYNSIIDPIMHCYPAYTFFRGK